jgi:hypothetical protein
MSTQVKWFAIRGWRPDPVGVGAGPQRGPTGTGAALLRFGDRKYPRLRIAARPGPAGAGAPAPPRLGPSSTTDDQMMSMKPGVEIGVRWASLR